MKTRALSLAWGAILLAAPCQANLTAGKLLANANALYFKGGYGKALELYQAAAKLDSTSPDPWINGAVILQETGRPQESAQWYRRAADISASADILNALGWAEFRLRQLSAAREDFTQALQKDPNDAYAWLGLARVEMASGQSTQAVLDLEQAQKAQPLLDLVPYYRGLAYENLGNLEQAAAALRQAVIADSYFMEGREALSRLYLQNHDYNEAWRQISLVLDSEPRNRFLLKFLRRIEPLLTLEPSRIRRGRTAARRSPEIIPALPSTPKIPRLRIGIGADGMGNPRMRKAVAFKVNGGFSIIGAQTGRKLLEEAGGETWKILLKPIKKNLWIVIYTPLGRQALISRKPIIIKPLSSGGFITINDLEVAGPGISAEALRGTLELAVYRSTLRLVNIVDLESYTQGLLAAEMPIDSPIEALKVQAVIARTNALYLKRIFHHHRKQGYDLCDGQHCQVYEGIRAESPLARQIVDDTRGQVVLYKGKLAQVIYSANCGGYTQSGSEVSGWGDQPYLTGITDRPNLGPRPASPWELRQWLFSWPKAYCSPSPYVYPSHFRWTRVVPFQELSDKLNAELAIGKFQGLRVLRRSSAGNVNSILILGSKRNVKINSEIKIRGLLAVGSLRSTLFVADVDYGADLKPNALIFYGGGWGHGVGLCQSGTMGRAQAGQTYEEIIKAYFKGAKIGWYDY